MKPTREQAEAWAEEAASKAAYYYRSRDSEWVDCMQYNLVLRAYAEGQKDMRECEHTSELRAQLAQQEPVAWLHPNGDLFRSRAPNASPLYLHPRADAKDAARKIVENIVDATLDELDESNRVRKAVVRIMRRELDAAMKGDPHA